MHKHMCVYTYIYMYIYAYIVYMYLFLVCGGEVARWSRGGEVENGVTFLFHFRRQANKRTNSLVLVDFRLVHSSPDPFSTQIFEKPQIYLIFLLFLSGPVKIIFFGEYFNHIIPNNLLLESFYCHPLAIATSYFAGKIRLQNQTRHKKS